MSNSVTKQFHFGVYGVIEVDSQLLVVHKSRGPYEGLLDLPGGRPEHGENLHNTLKREILEETGIRIQNFSFLDDFSCVSNYSDLHGNDIELYHVGLIYLVHSIDSTMYSPSIFAEDVRGSTWIDKCSIIPKRCAPLLLKVINV